MMRPCRRFARFLVAIAFTFSGVLVAPTSAQSPRSSANGLKIPPKDRLGAAELAREIDRWIGRRWQEEGIMPAPRTSDAEFLRRVYLDLFGRIPSVHEARRFLDESSLDKRARLIDELLDRPTHVTHFTRNWRKLMIPEAASDIQLRQTVPDFEAWLRRRIARNAGYDELVRDLLTAPIDANAGSAVAAQGAPSPVAFFVAKGAKPENLAASTARLFLGVRLECAQCHKHPFADWTQEQFWSYAAFFSGIQPQDPGNVFGGLREIRDRSELAMPDGDDAFVQARFLDNTAPRWRYRKGPRHTLAEWLTAPGNPYFARAAVNRTWAHFFGIGFVDPVDDLGAGTPPSHPVLFDTLAARFAETGFDIRFLVRAILLSDAYQLSSLQTDSSQDDRHFFARRVVLPMSADQLFDSLVEATGFREAASANPNLVLLNDGTPRGRFLQKFADQGENSSDATLTILQALTLMNGSFIADATSLKRSLVLAAVAESPFLDADGRIETLFLATLSRKPSAEESLYFAQYTGSRGAAKDTRSALADVFWALLNSSEFALNH